jgi:hypothetical protein
MIPYLVPLKATKTTASVPTFLIHCKSDITNLIFAHHLLFIYDAIRQPGRQVLIIISNWPVAQSALEESFSAMAYIQSLLVT